MAFLFENLTVYQSALDVSERVFRLTDGFASKHRSLADQMNRASVSIVANLAEGNGRRTKADRKHFFDMSRASTFESVALLEIANRRSLVSSEERSSLRAGLEEVSKMQAGLIRGIENRQ